MTGKTVAATVAAVVFILIMCAAGGAMLSAGSATVCSLPTLTSPASTPPTGGWPAVGTYDPSQVELAGVIVSVGAAMGVPTRGSVIAVATAIQESGLRNPTGGDRDSVGLFQQRPSQGWGTPEQLHDPVYASQKFFAKLMTIPNWQQMPLTEAAQAVQISSHPHAYATWEPDATLLVHTVGSEGSWAIPGDLEQCLSNCPAILSSGPPPSPSDGGCGTAMLTRAASWLTAWNGRPVPYLSSGDPDSWFQGYRRDCSGYVSMALGLPGPGLDTFRVGGLAQIHCDACG